MENGKLYKVVNDKANHCQANVGCNIEGARLATMKTQQEIDIFKTIESTIGQSFLIQRRE